jgi:integrase
LRQEPTEQSRQQTQTIADLIRLYRASGDFLRLAASTRKLYLNVLVAAEDHFGTLSIVALKSDRMPAQIRKWRDEIADRPRAADTRVEVLSSLLQWGVRYGHVAKNPAHGIEGIHRANRSDIIWTEEELKRLLSAATPECARAITVAAYTGLRLGDVVGLTWEEVDFEIGIIERRTNKSGGRTHATPPLLPEARRALETASRIAATVLTSGLRRPWTESGLGNAFREARNNIGVNKRFHDLRGTAATRFASAGFGAQQIAGFMGWEEGRVEAILKRYVSRRRLAEDAARRLREVASQKES